VPDLAVWILVAIAAILVGAAVPALIQLRRTLLTAERTLETTGKRLEETLTQLAATLERVNRASAELEQGVHRVSGLLESLGRAGDALMSIRASLRKVAVFGASTADVVYGLLRTVLGRRRPRTPHDGDPRTESATPPQREEEIIR
jgi:uncharacterized protein YoxC